MTALAEMLRLKLAALDAVPPAAPVPRHRGRAPKHRVIRRVVRQGREFTLHATRGWKSRRL